MICRSISGLSILVSKQFFPNYRITLTAHIALGRKGVESLTNSRMSKQSVDPRNNVGLLHHTRGLLHHARGLLHHARGFLHHARVLHYFSDPLIAWTFYCSSDSLSTELQGHCITREICVHTVHYPYIIFFIPSLFLNIPSP
jgi:hypothetical protein